MSASAGVTIADAILNSRVLLTRYLAGFDDTNHTRQAPGLPNHVAWNLGHLALTMSRCDERIAGRPPSADDFGGPGDPARFDIESVCFGSKPTSDSTRYPNMARCEQIFGNACERLAATFRTLPDTRIAGMIEWGTLKAPIEQIGMRMVFHNGMHTGEIADLRRAFGLKSIFA